MAKPVLTSKDHQFIRENYTLMASRGLAEHIGCSRAAVQKYMRANNLVPSAEMITAFRVEGSKGRTTFTAEQDEVIKANYLTMPIKAIGKQIKKSWCGIMGRLNQLGLVIPPEIISQNKLVGTFKPGSVPASKGKPMSAAMYEKLKPNMFKKGQLPGNTMHDGAIVIRRNYTHDNGRAYKWIRISKAKWEHLHVYQWEQMNGPTPPGHMITFIDGDSLNCNLDNLKCITRQEHVENMRNSDGYIATLMSVKRAERGNVVDESLRDAILQNKDLIDLKRQSLNLKKSINEQRKKV